MYSIICLGVLLSKKSAHCFRPLDVLYVYFQGVSSTGFLERKLSGSLKRELGVPLPDSLKKRLVGGPLRGGIEFPETLCDLEPKHGEQGAIRVA